MLFFLLFFGLVGRHSVGLKVILFLFGFLLFAPPSIQKGIPARFRDYIVMRECSESRTSTIPFR